MDEIKSPSPEKHFGESEIDSLFPGSDSIPLQEGMESSTPFPAGGLSEEEANDLNSLITRLRKGDPDLQSGDVVKQIRSLENRLGHMGELVLKFDNSMKILFELVRLFQRKSEILNHRIKELEKHLSQNQTP
ncbi:MAG: hypothetical protein AB1659_09150 [Thermodesulfobacteriota bacterium]